MKKLDFFFLMVLICAIGMVGCSQQDSVSEPAEKTAEIEIAISKADLLKSGALGEIPDADYCDSELGNMGKVVIDWEVSIDGGVIWAPQDEIEWEDYKVDEGVILDRIVLSWADLNVPEEVTSIKVKITGVTIEGLTAGTYAFAAPAEGALFESYITDEKDRVGYEYDVELYQKVYVGVKVLCFNEQVIPEFGFNWFDFEIFTGEEVCIYFNCKDQNDKDQNNEGKHKNVNAVYKAEFKNGDAWQEYWTTEVATYDLNCIPLPGNYTTEGVKISVNGYEVYITPDQIDAFLSRNQFVDADGDGTIGPNENEFIDYASDNDPDTEEDYTLIVDEVDDAYFLHFVLKNCTLFQ